MGRYKKTLFILALLMGMTTLNILAKNKQDESKFKNLQVYPKDISEEKLDKDMHLFNASLGVKCGFCHVRVKDEWNYASDEKGHKKIARDMMRMTNELNEKWFGADLKTAKETDLAMNCFTCHRGEEEPIVPWDSTNVKPKQPVPQQQWWPGGQQQNAPKQ